MDKSNSAPPENSFADDLSLFPLPNISEDSELRSNISALDLDPELRAKMLQRHSSGLNVRRSLAFESPYVMYNGKFMCLYVFVYYIILKIINFVILRAH